MPRSSSNLSDELTHRFAALDRTRKQISELADRGVLSNRAVEHMYEGLFLSAHVAFEGFLEDLFIGLLVTDQGLQSARTDIMPRLIVKTHQIARETVIGPKKQYVDWLPYERTIELATIYFRGGRPFSELSQPQQDHIRKCHTIRNAIAHRSKFSMSKFETQVIGTTPLPPRERKPAGYLKGYFRSYPPQTRYENLIAQLLQISRQLAR